MLDDVQGEARLSETRTTRDEDEVGRLQAPGLRVERIEPRLDPDAKVAALVDLLRVPAERRLERHDVAVERRLAHGEEQLLRVRDRGCGLFARQCEPGDLVRDADEAAEERGPFDDRGVARRVRHGRYVLHEPDEELGATDRVELAVGGELRLHARERDRVAPLRDAGDGREDDAVLLSREVRRP